jgi:S-adenosylmethionine hydrolase
VSAPVITFLSDYGYEDDFVGVCHGVIAAICPEARVIDITHGLPRHDVLAGAIILRNVLPYMPPAVHLAVVDPEVGAERRAVALRLADGALLVGPDNGLLSLAASSGQGIAEAAEISRSPFRLEPVSATFHGRDIFAPVAAHLAAGASLADAGAPLDPVELVSLDLPTPTRDGDALLAHVVYTDHFGNLQLDIGHDDLAGLGLRLGDRVSVVAGERNVTAQLARTFADVPTGEPLLYEDAYGTLALAVRCGDAGARLALTPGDELRLERA